METCVHKLTNNDFSLAISTWISFCQLQTEAQPNYCNILSSAYRLCQSNEYAPHMIAVLLFEKKRVISLILRSQRLKNIATQWGRALLTQ